MDASVYLVAAGVAASSAVSVDSSTTVLAPPSTAAQPSVDLGAAYIFPSDGRDPEWVAEMSAIWAGVGAIPLMSARSGAVLEVNLGSRICLITFGVGHLKLNRKLLVHDFGRRVAINGVDPSTVKQVSRQALEGSFIQAIESAAKSGSVYQFGIDVERDLLQGIFGRCRKAAFGRAIGGATSLRVSVDGGLSALLRKLPLYLKLYDQKIRAKDFLWYERIREVVDPTAVAGLDGALDSHITAGGRDVLLGLPQTISGFDQITAFRFERPAPKGGHAVYPDPQFADWVAWCVSKGHLPSLPIAEKKRLYIDFQSGAEASFPMADSIFWETMSSGAAHIRHDGRWFRIDPAFVNSVKTFIAALPPCSTVLPAYTGGTELAYNTSLVSSVTGSYLLDGKNVTLRNAKSAIEPCDVYHFDGASGQGRMFFVKRKKVGSSGLTHLFSQVLSGVDCFFHRDGEFRDRVNDHLAALGGSLGFPPVSLPTADRWKVSIVICGAGPTGQLPFLSQVALKRAIEALRTRYNLSFELTFV